MSCLQQTPREMEKNEYSQKLIERYKHMPEIRRIHRKYVNSLECRAILTACTDDICLRLCIRFKRLSTS